MLNHKISQTYLVAFISFFLFLAGVSNSSAATIVDIGTSKLSTPLNKSSVVFVFMSQEARDTSDVTIIMEKPILPPPSSVESYGNWRDMDWKDPFTSNGSVRRLDRNDAKKTESSMTLELSMPSPVVTTEGSVDDLIDPFAPMSAPVMSDPFEGYNRFMFDFNEGFYDSVMEPVVRGYRDVVNEDIRMAISNIFDNAMAPLKLVSSILQGDLDKSGRVIGRTVINTTIGIGGMFDVADKAFQIKDVNEDLDQVLGAYGVPTGPYIVIPLLGPSHLRNMIGKAGGTFLSPVAQFSPGIEVGAGLTVSDKVNDTSFIVDDIEQLEESSIDKYESVRDFYNQYRFKLQNE